MLEKIKKVDFLQNFSSQGAKYMGTEYMGTEYMGTEYMGTEYMGTEYMKNLAILSFIIMGILGSCIGNSYGAAPTCSSRQNNANSALACATDSTTLEIHQGETLRLGISLPSSLPVNAPLYWDKMDALSQKDATSDLIALVDGSIQIKSTTNPFKNDSQNPIELVVSASSRATLGKHSGQSFNITRMDTGTKLSLGWFYITVLPKIPARGEGNNQKTCRFFVFCLL